MLWDWLEANWIAVIETLTFIIGVVSIRDNTKARHLSNLISLTKNHRELSTLLIENSALRRTLSPDRNLSKEPLTGNEEEFVNLKILHFKAAFEAIKDGMAVNRTGVVKDVKEFFSLPAILHIWKKTKPYYELKFISFVENALKA
jgi:hypothetical protein